MTPSLLPTIDTDAICPPTPALISSTNHHRLASIFICHLLMSSTCVEHFFNGIRMYTIPTPRIYLRTSHNLLSRIRTHHNHPLSPPTYLQYWRWAPRPRRTRCCLPWRPPLRRSASRAGWCRRPGASGRRRCRLCRATPAGPKRGGGEGVVIPGSDNPLSVQQ